MSNKDHSGSTLEPTEKESILDSLTSHGKDALGIVATTTVAAGTVKVLGKAGDVAVGLFSRGSTKEVVDEAASGFFSGGSGPGFFG